MYVDVIYSGKIFVNTSVPVTPFLLPTFPIKKLYSYEVRLWFEGFRSAAETRYTVFFG